MSIEKACLLGGVSRAGYYRRLEATEPDLAGAELRDLLQRIALENRRYGARRVTRELARRGWRVNHKKVERLLREDNLLALRKRRFVLTTDSRHGQPVYPNLVPLLEVTGVDQLWEADLTYVRLRDRFVYVAVVLDAFSRRVIGWRLGPSLEAKLAVRALEMAFESRRPRPGLVHHSDRGSQYASRDYVALLERNGAVISMSRAGNPYDNARVESFMKTLKAEEVNARQYRTIQEARASIGTFLEQVYNRTRLHSALGYVPPEEFERSLPDCAGSSPRNPPYRFAAHTPSSAL